MKAIGDLPEDIGAFYDHESNVIYVRPGMEVPDIFRCVSLELAHAELARSMGEDYNRDSVQFSAYCASYVLCRQFGVDVSSFNFDGAMCELEGREAKDIRAELSQIRDVTGEIGGRMKEAIRLERAERDEGDR
jgi:hypothetical protein